MMNDNIVMTNGFSFWTLIQY